MPRIDQHLGFTRFAADEYYKQALEAFKKGDFDAAVDDMKNAIAALPRKAEYYAARGFMYLEDGVTQSALDDFDQALKIFPHEMLGSTPRFCASRRRLRIAVSFVFDSHKTLFSS